MQKFYSGGGILPRAPFKFANIAAYWNIKMVYDLAVARPRGYQKLRRAT